MEERIETLAERQHHAFNVIIQSLEDNDAGHRFFFLDSPGGSGKVSLYNTLIDYCSTRRKSVLSYAITGIAADLLKNGRTAHSGFCLPVPILETTMPSMKIPFLPS